MSCPNTDVVKKYCKKHLSTALYFFSGEVDDVRVWKSSLLIMGLCVLVLSSMTAVAETESDAQGDVWHYVFPYYQSQTVANQPNSDIKEIKAEISGDQITLSMTLWPGGTFTRGQYEYASYIMFYNTSDAWYTMTYGDLTGEEAGGMAMGYSLAGYTPPYSTGEVVVNGNTISATMDKVGEDTTTTELYGLAWVWEGHGEDQWDYDHWHDWVGDYDWAPDFGPGDNGDNGGGGGTPGFETLAVIAAIGVALIIFRRRK